jgi:mannose/fructose/N-acetylgalactosamine-specific phosphotransferase system component IIC
MPYIVIFIFILSIIFFILGFVSKREWDEGAASVNIAIGVLLLILDIILFVIMIGTYHLYEKQLDSGMKFILFSCGFS